MKVVRIILVLLVFLMTGNIHAQFWEKIKEGVKEVTEETLKRKTAEKAEKETDKAFDSIFNNKGRLFKKKKSKKKNKKGTSKKDSISSQEDNTTSFTIYQKFDFVPGENVLLQDNFLVDNLGDFPSKWNTNGSGEIVEIHNKKWLMLINKSIYIPMISNSFSKNYTIEFDLITKGLDKHTSSQAKLELWLQENNSFKKSPNECKVEIPLAQYTSAGFVIEKRVNNERIIRNTIGKDVRSTLLKKTHISISINQQRFRMWMDENKIIDIPQFIPDRITSFKIHPRALRDGLDQLFITNFKIADGTQDLRSKLLNEGEFSTTGILFNSGSATIQPTSYGIIKKIANVINQSNFKIKIIGHTDADGDNTQNMKLSKERAETVKRLLVSQFEVHPSSLTTEGKGEEEPIDSNATEEGKANNRRVAFIKIN